VSCQTLSSNSLPGFPLLPRVPRALARAALSLTLSGAGCGSEAEEEAQKLSQELGPTLAAMLLKGLKGLRDVPAPQTLSLLLSLAQPCLETPTAGGTDQRMVMAASGCRHVRRKREEEKEKEEEEEDPCSPAGEEEAHKVVEWIPGVSTFYNLGTSIYFAFQGCEVVASSRALEVAEDLGYAGLAAITAGLGGPVALGVQLGLQPGLKAGVRALFDYFTSQGDPQPLPTAHSGPVLID
ncbi:APOF protein, partial [Turnix velox]|nr:APOF protein [Turnix velox]